jgi:micrococcal nuclease
MVINYTYNATLNKVIDGDTVDLNVDLGFKITLRVRVRLERINTHELNSSIEEERVQARLALFRVRELLTNKPLLFKSNSLDKYGRSIGSIVFEGTKNLSDILLTEGFAKLY